MIISPAFASLRFGALAMVLVCGLAASPTFAQVRPPDDGFPKVANADFGPGLPFFDVRLDSEGLPLANVTARIDALTKSAGWPARDADAARLRGMIDGLVIDQDPLTGAPGLMRSTSKLLTPPKFAGENWTPIGVLKDFLAAYPALNEGAAGEIDAARVERDFGTDHNGAHHFTFQQQIRGADLFDAEIRANITRNGELINLQNTMLPRPAGDFVTPGIKFDAKAAIIIAAANVGVRLSVDPVAATEPAAGNMKEVWANLPDLRSDEKVVTKLIYFPLDRDTIHPAWHVIVPVTGVGHTYDVFVDAVDGSILRRHNWLVWDTTQPVTLRVYPSDGIAPGSPGNLTNTGFQFPVVPRQLLTFNPSDVSAFSPNGWINDGNNATVGNNVNAHLDLTNTNPAGAAGVTGSSFRVFDFAMDPAQDPSTYQSASVAEFFFRANWYHDKLMVLGFNEAAHNFQTVNVTGQGVANDAVQADCQDSASNTATSSNRNNANFSTGGVDGDTGRCQMYVFTGPTPDRDGSFDGDIVYHELTHGTSIRLHGSGSLGNVQSGGMGEGWSDFVGLSLLAESTDDPDAVYCTGGYTTYQLGSATFTGNYYFGIRRYPYSTNMLKSPLTYKDIATAQAIDHQAAAGIPRSSVIGNTANEVHNIGEYWCATLLDCRAQLWHTYGFAGNQRMLQLVIDAMKLDVSQPTLIQARDSIIAADNADFGGVDVPALWTAFARRGLGFSATSPASTTTTGVHEAFDAPIFASFTYPDGLPTQLSPTAATTFRVNVAGTGLTPTSGTGQIFLSINGGAYSSVALTATGANQYTATIPAQSCLAPANFYFATGTSAGTKTDPSTAPTATYAALTYTSTTTPVNDGFEVASGWTTGTGAGDTATTGMWERATPQATAAQPGAAHAGTLCWVTGATANLGATTGTGANDVDGGFTTLFSPVYDLSAFSDATVSYWRWYSNGTSPTVTFDFTNIFRVEVSLNGGMTWTPWETVGPGSASDPNVNPGWRFASKSFSSLSLVPTSTVKFRFIAQDLNGTFVEAALDDFRIDSFACTVAATTGACCTAPAGSCSVATSAACTTAGGTYQGDASACAPAICTPTSYALIITKSGSGRGTVSSNLGGILCGNICGGTVAFGANLTLTATPDANSAFVGWSGACAGAADCTQSVSGPITADAQFRCKADFNNTGGISVADIFDFLTSWFSGAPSADFNGLNGVNVQDIFDFLAAWFAGCP